MHVTTVPMTLHFLEGQPEFMAAHGIETHAISSPGEDLEAFLRKEPRVSAHVIPMRRTVAPLTDLVGLVRMVVTLRRLRPTIVHTHTPKGGLLGVIAARLTGVPLVIHHIHGGVWLTARGVRRTLARWTDRVTCALAHRVLCVSHSVRDALRQEGLCPAEKVEVLAEGSINGVDAERRFNPATFDAGERIETRRRLGIPVDAVVVGFVGRITREKGLIELAEAWERLRAAHADAHLLLVGPQDAVTPLPQPVVAALSRDGRVHFAGMDWNTPPLYAAMDVFALPTYREGFPVVLLEAAAMGLPAVATRVPGCIDAIVDGVTGALIEVRDAGQLHDALHEYLKDPGKRRQHGDAARRRALEYFRPERIWRELLLRYQLVMGVDRPATSPKPHRVVPL